MDLLVDLIKAQVLSQSFSDLLLKTSHLPLPIPPTLVHFMNGGEWITRDAVSN